MKTYKGYKGIKHKPLTKKELEEKHKDALDEMKEVKSWLKEEEDKLKADKFKTHQAKSACKRNLKKAIILINIPVPLIKKKPVDS